MRRGVVNKSYVALTESFDKILGRYDLPADVVEELRNLFSAEMDNLTETIEYLQSQLTIMRRFQYGQRSERLKKKR